MKKIQKNNSEYFQKVMLMEEGLKILYKTYWSAKGWKDGTISKEDFELEKRLGYMFDYPKVETHEETLNRLFNVLEKVNPRDIAEAFLYSLSTRKLEYRSALGSYYYAAAIPKHTIYHGYHQNIKHCYICGWTTWAENPSVYELRGGLNIYNFERYKFGGVRHTYLDYALFDLEQFLKLPKVMPTQEDKEILFKILACQSKLQPKDKVGKYRDIISKEKIFKTNRDEISNILDVLGICGVLSNRDYPCYEELFVDEYERGPMEAKNDFEYPVNRWYVRDGVNEDRFEKVFFYKYQ